MRQGRKAGLWLALACAIGGAAWMMQGAHEAGEPVAHATTNDSTASQAIAMPADATIASPKPFHIDAAIARAAVRDGKLRIAMPDGSEQVVAIERQFTDSTGHWNVVGRAPTTLGEQPMVLTFGARSVFGTLPMRDGRMQRIATNARGEVVIAPAGGLVPESALASGESHSDVLRPPVSPTPLRPSVQRTVSRAVAPRTSASAPMRVPGASPSVAPVAAAAPIDTTPVRIDVLAVYSAEQVTLRGNVAAVETEFANLFAVANQAHIDSGSRVRLNVVDVMQSDAISPTAPNQTVLQDANSGPLEDARNAVGADLVTILRPHLETDWTCGIAFTPGFALWRTRTFGMFGYAVVNDDSTCGPLVTAHEIGHNLGAMHDRETDAVRNGQVKQGAYWFSFGYHGKSFSTIMAYEDASRPWVPYFSNPASTKCGGLACGVAEYADDVRNYNLMAPAIAALRGPPGTMSIADSESVEPHHAPVMVGVEVRLSGRAPAEGLTLPVEVLEGGTATYGEDFDFPNGGDVFIPGYSSSGMLYIQLLPDAVAEADETIALRISSPVGAPIADSDAVYTILDAPRVTVTGKLWFPEDMTPPTESIEMTVLELDGPGTSPVVTLSPPDFAYSLDVPFAAQAKLQPNLPAPFAMDPFALTEARQAREWLLFPQKGVRVTGTLRAAAGMVMPTEPFQLTFAMVRHGVVEWDYATIEAPDYTFSKLVPPGIHVTVQYDNPTPTPGNSVPFASMMLSDWNLRADVNHDIVLSTKPSLRAFRTTRDPQITGGLPVHLSAPAPAGGVTFRCRTVDGTAKAGKDYVAMSATHTIPEGQWGFHYCGDFVVLRDGERPPEHLYMVLDQVVGADLTTPQTEVVLYSNQENGPMVTGGRNRPQVK